ncbi:MAG TPA: hypothetical protein ENJ80_00585 [Gammaproteobacteria bacterium]|nr:hypothetical protein [Gammaproteobacteria bacterium]
MREQRAELFELLLNPVRRLARACQKAWPEREALTEVLLAGFDAIPYCTYLYVVDLNGFQLSDNVGRNGRIPEHFGRDRSARPYMKEARPDRDFILSEAYISLSAHRPSITALQTLYRDGEPVGYLGVDLDLRDLPMSGDLYTEPGQWHQIKGDPAIRGTVFQQTRVESALDRNIDQVMSILEELIVERGMFQCVLHFSSSRATIWVVDDPFRYRILQSDALSDPDICLAYPPRPYPADAEIPADSIAAILQGLKKLRFADDTIYLRSASINIFNGLISLTFSCDGSHYMPYSEFLDKDTAFWFGGDSG